GGRHRGQLGHGEVLLRFEADAAADPHLRLAEHLGQGHVADALPTHLRADQSGDLPPDVRGKSTRHGASLLHVVQEDKHPGKGARRFARTGDTDLTRRWCSTSATTMTSPSRRSSIRCTSDGWPVNATTSYPPRSQAWAQVSR